MVVLDDVLARDHLRFGERLLDGVDARRGHTRREQRLEPFVGGALEDRLVEEGQERVPVGVTAGARRESFENYIKRLTEIENIANSFEGVDKTFAIQAGREVRVIVRPDDIDDLGAAKLSKNIAKKIEESLQYPGVIKVNVIRETRSIEYAK